MIITGKHLSRRTLLRGIGTSLALPFLDAMTPALAAAKPSPMRIAFVYVPNGIVMNNWTPEGSGADFAFSPILKPLEPFRKQTLIVSRLMNHQANALGDGGGDHARAGASFLTGAHPRKTGGADIHAGISADQVVAQAIGKQTLLPSLELGVDDNRVVGHCDSGYSCAYTNSISWKSASTPLPPEANPRAVFERLFGDGDPNLDDATRRRRAGYRKSLLDSTRQEAAKLERAVGPADRRKIGEYLDSLREVEQRIEKAEANPVAVPQGTDKPAGIPPNYSDHTKLLFDLLYLAYQTDLTRVSTMVLGREGSVRTYDEVGVPEPHHPLSHHRNMPEALEKLTRINTYHVSLFAHLVKRLAGTADGEGSLLDRTMLVYGCGIADSNRHTHEDLPVAVVGGGKTIASGRHAVLAEPLPVTNLYLSLLERMDAGIPRLGDSTGPLTLL